MKVYNPPPPEVPDDMPAVNTRPTGANIIARQLLRLPVSPAEIASLDSTPVNWHFYADELSRANGNAAQTLDRLLTSESHADLIRREVDTERAKLRPAGDSFLAWALRYAAMGWHVFPLRPKTKDPITTHGFKDATTDPAKIRQWWTHWPTANIGLACGLSGLAVIDPDGDEGRATWERLKAEHGIVESPLTSITPGKIEDGQWTGPGCHLIYQGNCKSKNDALGAKVDTKSDGGYIVLPPSVHPDHPEGPPYQWADESQLTIAPPSLPPIIAELIAQADQPVDPWQIFTLADAYTPRPPVKMILDGVIGEGTLNIVYGAPGTLKSMELADLAVSVAAGKSFLPRPNQPGTGIATTQGAVLWLDFDNGQRRTHERFAALARARELPESVPVYYVSMPETWLDAGNTQDMQDLAGRVQSLGVRLVIIDNLTEVSGDANQNSDDMKVPMAGLRWLSETTGAAVIVIHHERKAGPMGDKRQGETLRGFSGIEAKADLILLAKRDDLIVTLTPTKERGASVKPIAAKFAYEDDANHELVTARFWAADVTDVKAAAKDETIAKIKAALAGSDKPLSKNALANLAGVRRQTFDAVLSEMLLAGQVYMSDGPRGSHLFSLPKGGE
ncbi:MAG: bifunctional DNA primase/polymerase [Chloroflexi bacterium]|nr:bifunctional DNA primase/polymerase [Chloroflexota bacterium]